MESFIHFAYDGIILMTIFYRQKHHRLSKKLTIWFVYWKILSLHIQLYYRVKSNIRVKSVSIDNLIQFISSFSIEVVSVFLCKYWLSILDFLISNFSLMLYESCPPLLRLIKDYQTIAKPSIYSLVIFRVTLVFFDNLVFVISPSVWPIISSGLRSTCY